jgi:hypothetical protein
MLTITEHSNLELHLVQGIGWSQISELDQESRAALKDVVCIEVRIDGVGEDQLSDEHAFHRRLDEVASSLINEDQAFVVKMTRPSPKSRIKSYKGIFPRNGTIRRSDFYEQEVETKGGSLFIGTARFAERNKVEALALAHNRLEAFLIFTHADSAELASKKVVGTLLNSRRVKPPMINFPKLVAGVVDREQSLLVFGRDGAADKWLSLCLFAHHSFRSEWLKKMMDSLKVSGTESP